MAQSPRAARRDGRLPDPPRDRVGPRTRIEVVTEGILTRMLQHDPALEPVGMVIFDEFHERSLHADLGLALALQSRAVLRPDLRLLVMSATLEGAAVAALLGGAPIITSEGRGFPVTTRYLPRRPDVRLEEPAANAVRRGLAEEEGDILVFLPGPAEIRSTADLLDAELGLRSGRSLSAPRHADQRPSGRRDPAEPAGAREGGARDLDRRDQSHHRWRSGGDRCRARPGPTVLASYRHDPADHRSRLPLLGRSAPRPGRANRSRGLLSPLGGRRGSPPRSPPGAGDSRGGSRPARTGTGRDRNR